MTEARLWEGENIGMLSTILPTGSGGLRGWARAQERWSIERPTRRARGVPGRASFWSFKSCSVKCIWAPAGHPCQSVVSRKVLRTARDVVEIPIPVFGNTSRGRDTPSYRVPSQVMVFPLSPNSSSIPFSSPWWARMWSWNSRMT